MAVLGVLLLALLLGLAFWLGRRQATPPLPRLPAADLSPGPVSVLPEPVILDRLAHDPRFKDLDPDLRAQAARSIHRAAQRRIPGARPREVRS